MYISFRAFSDFSNLLALSFNVFKVAFAAADQDSLYLLFFAKGWKVSLLCQNRLDPYGFAHGFRNRLDPHGFTSTYGF